MKIKFLWIGKSKNKAFDGIINTYLKRLNHYCSNELLELKEPKKSSTNIIDIKKSEADLILSKLSSNDYVVLLDELGRHFSSVQLSEWVQHKLNISVHQVVIVIAGAYGADQVLKDRADEILSLSHLTLTHDMARIFIIEQIYRAFTIIKGEKYHNA